MTISETHPLHIFKFCPRCGSNHFTFDGVKAFDCETCKFKYYINEAAATAAVIVGPGGDIVLTRRKFEPRAGYYDLPGGFVDLGERAEDCMRREVLEELNLNIRTIDFLASFPNEYQFKGISYYTCDLAFVCYVDSWEGLQPADDVAEAMIIHPSKIDFSVISFPSIENILKVYLNKLDN